MITQTPTLIELRDFLNTLANEQLKQPVRWWNEGGAGIIQSVELLDENYIDDDCGATIPESVWRASLEANSSEEGRIIYPAGTIILETD